MAARWRVPSEAVEVLPLGQRENAGREGDAVSFDDDAAVMDGIVGKENGFQHFRRGLAIHRHAGFGGFLQLDGLLDGDERADADFGQALDGLDDDLDVFALFAAGGEKRMGAQFSQNPAQFRLENNQDRHRGEGDEGTEQPAQHFQMEHVGHDRQAQDQQDKAVNHRRSARAAHEFEAVVDAHRQNGNLQHRPPAVMHHVLDRPPGVKHFLYHVRHLFAVRSALRSSATPCRVAATSWQRMICAPFSTPQQAQASDGARRSFAPAHRPIKDLREAPNNSGRSHLVKRRSCASNRKLCSSRLPNPIPTSRITCSLLTPQPRKRFNRSAKNALTSGTTSS